MSDVLPGQAAPAIIPGVTDVAGLCAGLAELRTLAEECGTEAELAGFCAQEAWTLNALAAAPSTGPHDLAHKAAVLVECLDADPDGFGLGKAEAHLLRSLLRDAWVLAQDAQGLGVA